MFHIMSVILAGQADVGGLGPHGTIFHRNMDRNALKAVATHKYVRVDSAQYRHMPVRAYGIL